MLFFGKSYRLGVRHSGRPGFTLIETAVTTLLVGLVLSSIAGLAVWILYAVYVTGRTVDVAVSAQDKMEHLLGTNYSSLASGSDSNNMIARAWTVTAGSNNTKEIVLTLNWIDTRGLGRSYTYRAIALDPSAATINFTNVFHSP